MGSTVNRICHGGNVRRSPPYPGIICSPCEKLVAFQDSLGGGYYCYVRSVEFKLPFGIFAACRVIPAVSRPHS